MQRQLELFAAPTDTSSGMRIIGGGGQLVWPGIGQERDVAEALAKMAKGRGWALPPCYPPGLKAHSSARCCEEMDTNWRQWLSDAFRLEDG
jgi:hypothetical protein